MLASGWSVRMIVQLDTLQDMRLFTGLLGLKKTESLVPQVVLHAAS